MECKAILTGLICKQCIRMSYNKEVIYNSNNHMINPRRTCAMRVTVVAGAQACLRCIDCARASIHTCTCMLSSHGEFKQLDPSYRQSQY